MPELPVAGSFGRTSTIAHQVRTPILIKIFPMRVAFAGTPPFAAVALKALIEAGHDVALVLSQPDRPRGRGMKLKPSPVKELALAHGLTVITPQTLSVKKMPEEAESALTALENAAVDVLIVAAYGLILPERALHAARGIGAAGDIRSLNIHGSILPRWRGAAPIQRAIEARDAETGVTLMKMEAGLDTGPMIEIVRTPITPQDTSETLTGRLAQLGAESLIEALARPQTLTCTPQPEEGVTYAAKLLKSETQIDWTLSGEALAAKIRAFNPAPGTWAAKNTDAGPVQFKLWDAEACPGTGKPGEVLKAKKELVIACGTGAIRAKKLQKAGKGIMDAAPFLQSFPLIPGEVLA